MNELRNFLYRLSTNLSAAMRSFMEGRYGTDRLNMVILCAGLVASLLSMLVRQPAIGLILWVLSYGLMFWAIFRCLSRNTYRRYQENRRFLQLINRVKDRHNCYFDCPKCRQTVRVLRGKGKISITCPRCHERFVKKT